MVKINMPTEAYPNLKQLDLPRCFVSVQHNFEMGRILDQYPSLFNHLWGSNNPKILAPIPKFAEIVNNPDVSANLLCDREGGEGGGGGGGLMAVWIVQQDIIIVQAMSDWPNDIISTAPVSLTVG